MPLQDTASAPARASGLERFGDDVARAIRAREKLYGWRCRHAFRFSTLWVGDGCFAVRTEEDVAPAFIMHEAPQELFAVRSPDCRMPILHPPVAYGFADGELWAGLKSGVWHCWVRLEYLEIVRTRSSTMCLTRTLSREQAVLMLVGLDQYHRPLAVAMPRLQPPARLFQAFPHLSREAAQRLGEHLQLQGGSWS